MNPRITISILAMNGLEMTKRCIESVLRFSVGQTYELILTDNGSNDGTAAYFDKLAEMPNVRVVRNQYNLGFIEPNKKALEMANGEFLVLLNNDCVVTPAWLQSLSHPFSIYPKAAISGVAAFPHSLQKDMSGFCGPRFEYVEFSCAMLKVAVMRKHGLFSDYLVGAYADDGDTCLRMRELGYTLHWSPIPIQHLKNATSRMLPQTPKWQAANSAAASKRWRHYLSLKDRRMDYPIVVHRVRNSDDFHKHLPFITDIRLNRPLSPIYVETDIQELFPVSMGVIPVDRSNAPDALRMSLDVPGNPHVVVVYVYPIFGGIHDEVAERFISSYIRFPSATPHELVVVSNGGPPTQKMQDVIGRVRHKLIVHDDSGWDIGAYQKAAREIPCDLMLWHGGNGYFRGMNWLERVIESWQKHGDAIYGATGSLACSPHIRTTGFWMPPRFLNEYPHAVTSDKGSRYSFEHGANSITNWMISRGHKALVVTWEGEYESNFWDHIQNGFQRGNQSAIMFGDRLTLKPYSVD